MILTFENGQIDLYIEIVVVKILITNLPTNIRTSVWNLKKLYKKLIKVSGNIKLIFLFLKNYLFPNYI